jgi:hypothetical protein
MPRWAHVSMFNFEPQFSRLRRNRKSVCSPSSRFGRGRHPSEGRIRLRRSCRAERRALGVMDVSRHQPDIEFNFNFVFGSNARFAGRLDPEVSQFHCGLARVAPVLEDYLHGDWFCLAAKSQISA